MWKLIRKKKYKNKKSNLLSTEWWKYGDKPLYRLILESRLAFIFVSQPRYVVVQLQKGKKDVKIGDANKKAEALKLVKEYPLPLDI